jgi:hypothetical protein
MARPPIQRETVREIKQYFIYYSELNATEVHRNLKKLKLKGLGSLRKTQEIVAEARREIEANPEAFTEDAPVKPWGNGWPESAEQIECLIRLLHLSDSFPYDPPISRREAKWALRIYQLFPSHYEGTFELRIMANCYAQREKYATVLGEDIYTEDLDAELRYQPWQSSENQESYNAAIKAGWIPPTATALTEVELEASINPKEYKEFLEFVKDIRAQYGKLAELFVQTILRLRGGGWKEVRDRMHNPARQPEITWKSTTNSEQEEGRLCGDTSSSASGAA